jgi:hypothetical protein
VLNQRSHGLRAQSAITRSACSISGMLTARALPTNDSVSLDFPNPSIQVSLSLLKLHRGLERDDRYFTTESPGLLFTLNTTVRPRYHAHVLDALGNLRVVY